MLQRRLHVCWPASKGQEGSLWLTPAARVAQELPAAEPEPVRLLLPIVLLSAIMRQRAHLPEGARAFAAAQLLPVIERVLEQEGARVTEEFTAVIAVELLVREPSCASGAALRSACRGAASCKSEPARMGACSSEGDLMALHGLRRRCSAPTWPPAQRCLFCWGAPSWSLLQCRCRKLSPTPVRPLPACPACMRPPFSSTLASLLGHAAWWVDGPRQGLGTHDANLLHAACRCAQGICSGGPANLMPFLAPGCAQQSCWRRGQRAPPQSTGRTAGGMCP